MSVPSRLAHAFLLLAVLPWRVAAQPIPAAEGGAGAPAREVRQQVGAAINNAGLQAVTELAWRWPSGRSGHPLRRGAHTALGVVHVLTPSMDRVGGWMQWAPLSILSVRAGVEPALYFGTFHSVQTFPGYDAPFDADTRSAGVAGRRAIGLRSYVSPAFQARLGPVAVRTTADVEWWRVNLAGPRYYEPARDALLATRGDALLNMTSVVLYQHERLAGGSSAAGVLHHLMRVFDAPQNRVQRLGLIGMHEFAGRPLRLPHLTVTATAWRYLDDPSKRDEWGAAASLGVRFVR